MHTSLCAETEEILRRVVAAREATLGLEDPQTLAAYAALALGLEKRGKLDEAE